MQTQDQARSGQSSAGDDVPANMDAVAAMLAERRNRTRTPLPVEQESKIAATGPRQDQSDAVSEQDATADADDQEQPEEGQADESAEQADAVIELDGEQVSIAQLREWKSGGMMQADYSRKTQALSEQARAVRQMEEAMNQGHFMRMREADEADKALERRLAQYADIDLYAIAQENPARATAIREQREAVKEQRQQLHANRQRYEAEWQQLTDHNLRLRAQAALPELKVRIPNWSDTRYAELSEHVVGRGADPEVVGRIVEPWFWELVNDAMVMRKGKALTLKNAIPLSPARSMNSRATNQQKQTRTVEQDAIRQARKAGTVKTQEAAVLAALQARRKR